MVKSNVDNVPPDTLYLPESTGSGGVAEAVAANANINKAISAPTTSTASFFLNTSSILLPQWGGTRRPRRVVQRYHRSNREVLDASHERPIFVRQVATYGGELLRTP